MPQQNNAVSPPLAPAELSPSQDQLSPWWLRAVLAVIVIGFSVLIWLTIKVHYDAPPIPKEVVDSRGHVLFTKQDILAGQAVFLKYGLMDNGSIWGHGGYLGPDFSARYLHRLAMHVAQTVATQHYDKPLSAVVHEDSMVVAALVRSTLKQNRYDAESQRLTFSDPEAESYRLQVDEWTLYFSNPAENGGLPAEFIRSGNEVERLTAFFAWSAWASVTNRPGGSTTYTNNFPYDPLAGNLLPGRAVLWSALSLIALLGGTAVVLLAFGKFDFLGWKSSRETLPPRLLPGNPTPAQRAVAKYFVIVCCCSLPKRSWAARLRIIALSLAISTASTCPAFFRAIFCGPGTCSWPSSGLRRPMSPAPCCWRQSWAIAS